MAFTEVCRDATFYSLVHAVLKAERDRVLNNRRTEQRHSFQGLQLVAPFSNGGLPDKSTFRSVQCVDLSANGFSYLSAEAPSSERLVVVFSINPLICLVADAVYSERLDDGEAAMYRVGCQFTGRIEDQELGAALVKTHGQ
ncbi:MAG TPA: hypothetical protein VKB78_10685 [Pirellulales bacterium]|nr:hypothetical protein [Pirellulales bacterium]